MLRYRVRARAFALDLVRIMSRAFDQTMTAFYNVLKRRFGDTHDDADLGSCAAELAALGTVRPLIDGTSGKVLGYECSIVTEKL